MQKTYTFYFTQYFVWYFSSSQTLYIKNYMLHCELKRHETSLAYRNKLSHDAKTSVSESYSCISIWDCQKNCPRDTAETVENQQIC